MEQVAVLPVRVWTTHLRCSACRLVNVIPLADSPPKSLACNRHRNRKASQRPAQSKNIPVSSSCCHYVSFKSLRLPWCLDSLWGRFTNSIMCFTPTGLWVCLCSVITVLDKGQLLDSRLRSSVIITAIITDSFKEQNRIKCFLLSEERRCCLKAF